MKKFLAALLSATLAASMLVGCGNGNTTNESDTSGTAEVKGADGANNAETAELTETNNTSTDALEFTVWCWDANVEAVAKAAEMYNDATGSNIVLDVVTIANEDSRNKLVTIGESGSYDSLPDICLMEDTAISQFVTTYPDMFADLTDYNIDWNQLVASKKATYTVDEGYYAIPMDGGASVAMYRTDYLKAAGYTVDELTDITWDEFIEIGSKVYDSTGHYLLVDDATIMFTARQIYASSGGQLFDESGNATFTNDKMALTLEIIKKLVDNNCLYIAGSWDEYIACLNDGTAAGVVNGMWINGNISQAEAQKGLWGVTNMPALDIEGAAHYANSGGASWVVSSKCEDVEAAVKFLSYELCGDGAQTYWEYLADYAGYVTTYLPVLNSGFYENLDNEYYGPEFFGNVASCVDGAPAFNASPYYMNALDALILAANNVVSGGDITAEMENGQDTLEFVMSE